jgi:hypothetical protein
MGAGPEDEPCGTGSGAHALDRLLAVARAPVSPGEAGQRSHYGSDARKE